MKNLINITLIYSFALANVAWAHDDSERLQRAKSELQAVSGKVELNSHKRVYLRYLESSEDYEALDFLAQFYLRLGDKDAAIRVYQEKILPWTKYESEKTRNLYSRNFTRLQKQDVEKETSLFESSIFKKSDPEERSKAYSKIRK